MNRNEEYQALLQELEPTPPALDGTAERALRRRRRDRRLRIFGVPAGSLAACFIAFVLLVNLFPPFARACGNVPVLRALAQAVAWSPSLSAAVENDYVQPIGQSQTVNGITATIEYVIVDQKQVNIFFTLKGEGYETLSAELPEFTPRAALRRAGRGLPSAAGDAAALHPGLPGQRRAGGLHHDLRRHRGDGGRRAEATAPLRPAGLRTHRSGEEPDILAEFTFDLEFDPTYTASGEIIPVNSTFQLDGQTLTVTEVEVYPTHVRVNVEGGGGQHRLAEGPGLLPGKRGRGAVRPISNGVSATGDPDTPAMESFRLESPYFAGSDHLTLHITGATWLDKDMERIRVDLENGTADRLPEGVDGAGGSAGRTAGC